MINLYNEDCLQAMRRMDTDQYDLAIVDPPYGIHEKLLTTDLKLNKSNKFALEYMKKGWDKNRPPKEYFLELFRVSKNQIIWGGNYFTDVIPVSRGWVCWDKQGDNLTVVNNELAWSSFDVALKMFRRCHGLDKGFMIRKQADKIIHPTQKPVALYKWILLNYAKEGDKILDTHLGSGSIAIACHDMGFSLDGYELDTEYYEAACKRLKEHQRQLQLPI